MHANGARMRRAALGALLGLSMALGGARPPPTDIAGYAKGHPVQEAFLADKARVRVLLQGRRTGKTVALIIAAALAMLKWSHEPDVWVVYISKTSKLARKQFWRPLKRMLADCGHEFVANETELSLELAGGGGIMLGGADDVSQIEKFRGFAVSLAIVDECGTYPSHLLQMLIEDVLEPATADVGGRMVFAGTPGPTLAGTWYELSGPQCKDGVHRGDMRSNPHLRRDLPLAQRLAAIEEFLAEIRERNGWTETNPTYVREWLGIWAQDDEALVFPLAANVNFYVATEAGPWGLPSHTETGFPLGLTDWRVVVAMDVGFTQANAYVVLATHQSLKRSYVLEVRKRTQQLIDPAERELRELLEKYSIQRGGRSIRPALVLDAGGMGKIHAEEMRHRMALPNIAADKRQKLSAISTTRDDLLSGRLQLVRTNEDGEDLTRLLADEWAVLVWNEHRDGIADGQEDHATDACIYGTRRLRDYTRTEPKPGPKTGSKQWYENKERKLLESAKKRARGSRSRGVKIG